MVLDRWRKIFRPKLSPQELLRKVVEEEHMTVRDLEGHGARGHKEFRNGDIVRIKESPYYPSLVDGFGNVIEVSPHWIMVSNIRTRYHYRHGKLIFTLDQLQLMSGSNE